MTLNITSISEVEPPTFKEKSEQRLDWLRSLRRPLTDEESDELRRASHAVYMLERSRLSRLRRAEQEMNGAAKAEVKAREATLLDLMTREIER